MFWILKRIVKENKWDWHTNPNFTLWVDKIAPKTTIGQSPCTLLYRTHTIFLSHLKIPALRLEIAKVEEDFQLIQHHLDTLIELDQVWKNAFENLQKKTDIAKCSLDNRAMRVDCKVGYNVLLWDKAHEGPYKHHKFDSWWLGPYTVHEVLWPNYFRLKTLDGEPLQYLVNRHHL